MSTVKPDGNVAVNEEVPTVTVTYYQQLAEQFSKALRELSAIVPPLDENKVATFTKSHLNVPRVFLETAVAAVERHPELQGVQKLNAQSGRDSLQYLEAFRPMLDELLAFAERLVLTLQTRQASLSRESLQLYQVAKGLARDARNPELSATVENLRRDLGRRGPASMPLAVRKGAKLAGQAARNSFIAAAMGAAPPPEGKAS